MTCCCEGNEHGRPNAYSIPRLLSMPILAVASWLIAMVGKGLGDGRCVKTETVIRNGKEEIDCVEYQNETDLMIHRWAVDERYKELGGQYFVFGCVLLCLILSGILFTVNHPAGWLKGFVWKYLHQPVMPRRHYTPPQALWVKIALCLGSLLLFVSGSIEAWYASGFGKLSGSQTIGWAIASGLCFLASLLFIIDFLIGRKFDEAIPAELNALV